ncbi:MAG: hypothetical protein LBS21_15880, partial [Clostridiales bacterium]|nr:hypothetical protein [Clostridiales bacterium]
SSQLYSTCFGENLTSFFMIFCCYDRIFLKYCFWGLAEETSKAQTEISALFFPYSLQLRGS